MKLFQRGWRSRRLINSVTTKSWTPLEDVSVKVKTNFSLNINRIRLRVTSWSSILKSESLRIKCEIKGVVLAALIKSVQTQEYGEPATRLPLDIMGICSFVAKWEMIGDNVSAIRTVSVKNVKFGRSFMPFAQRSVWLRGVLVNQQLTKPIRTGQLPQSNLYTQGKLK